MLSKKQAETYNSLEKCIKNFFETNSFFHVEVVGDTGIKHVINLLEDKFSSKIHFCILDLKTKRPIEFINEMRENMEKDLNFKSYNPTDTGKFKEALNKFGVKIKGGVLIVIRNFHKGNLVDRADVQFLIDLKNANTILGIDNESHKELKYLDLAVSDRGAFSKSIKCGFFDDLDEFKKFCEEENIDFEKFKDKMIGLSFNYLENEGLI